MGLLKSVRKVDKRHRGIGAVGISQDLRVEGQLVGVVIQVMRAWRLRQLLDQPS